MSNKFPEFGWDTRFRLRGQISWLARLPGRSDWPVWLGRPDCLGRLNWLGDWLVGQIGQIVWVSQIGGKGQVG